MSRSLGACLTHVLTSTAPVSGAKVAEGPRVPRPRKHSRVAVVVPVSDRAPSHKRARALCPKATFLKLGHPTGDEALWPEAWRVPGTRAGSPPVARGGRRPLASPWSLQRELLRLRLLRRWRSVQSPKLVSPGDGGVHTRCVSPSVSQRQKVGSCTVDPNIPSRPARHTL